MAPLNHPSGKRRRQNIAGSDASPTTAKRQRRTTESASTSNDKKPLRGMLIAVSSASQTATTVSSPSELHYKDIVKLCDEAGASVTSQVHQKVRIVVATQSAIDTATQRVRKAWSKGIPVGTVEWLQECVRAGKMVSMDDYRIQQPENIVATKKASDAKHEPVMAAAATDELLKALGAKNVKTSARVVDLGCCCACHETDATDCPWCFECSVNIGIKTE